MSGAAGAWLAQLAQRAEQALDDVARSGATEIVFVRHPRSTSAGDYLADLEERAAAADLATARVAVDADSAFDELAALTAAIVRQLRAPGPRARRGLVALLDAFGARVGGRAALADFDERMEEATLGGDLAALARSYLAAPGAKRTEAARIEAWLSGVELARVDAASVSALSARTAKRTLRDLTRLVRALGFRGTLVLIEGADVVTRLPPARRAAAYATIRELVDNADGGRGLVGAQIVIAGSTSLFAGPRSLACDPPLASRVTPHDEAPALVPLTDLPPPHRPLVDLAVPESFARAALPPLRPAPAGAHAALGTLLRGAHGLPAIAATPELSVGHERIDRSIDALFEHSRLDGSVFALLCGEYGSGKTHFLLHLAARALADGRPVMRLSIERLDADLGHPERHVARLVEHATLPPDGGLGPLDRLAHWTRSPRALARLRAALEAIAAEEGEAARAARKALTRTKGAARVDLALEGYLDGSELARRTPSPTSRRDAYAIVLLWVALLERMEGCAGPVVLIDEAETLYRGGATRAERRTAMRSLSFYCGGALPRACVVLALTPASLAHLREEAPGLLDDVAEQRTLLPAEDASMLCHRLRRTKPITVPALGRAQRVELAERLRATHALVRGAGVDPDWDVHLARLVEASSPRELVRRTVDRLERAWWTGGAATTTPSGFRRARSRG